jgi:alcohol dehydrogenase
MKAAIFHKFQGPVLVQQVSDPVCPANGVIIKVGATGICRSDWHGWMGHDDDIILPHVPGHELAGTIVEAGAGVSRFKPGDRVTLPFVCGCGSCPQCASGNQQVCDHQFQPGFTAWGSFAEYVAIERADLNLVKLPDEISFETAASLGCRFITSFRAVIDQGKVQPGQWVAVHGCGGVGLSAIMIAAAAGANVIAVDIDNDKLKLAGAIGASVVLNARLQNNLELAIREASGGGAHISLDALGSKETCFNSINSLRKRGKHIQVGLMLADQALPVVPMSRVIAWELEIIGSHGMQAFRYAEMLDMIKAGKLHPEKLIQRMVTLEEGAAELVQMDSFKNRGITVINRF